MNTRLGNTQPSILLSDFGMQVGIDNLSFDENDRCQLKIGVVDLNLEYHLDRNEILIFSRICDIDMKDNDLLLKLLRGNIASASLGTGTVGADPETRDVWWFDRIGVNGIDVACFQQRIQDALDWIDYWRRCLELPSAPSETDFGVDGLIRI